MLLRQQISELSNAYPQRPLVPTGRIVDILPSEVMLVNTLNETETSAFWQRIAEARQGLSEREAHVLKVFSMKMAIYAVQSSRLDCLVRDKPTASGRATLRGSADPARKDTLPLRGKPLRAGERAYARFREFSACTLGLQISCGVHS